MSPGSTNHPAGCIALPPTSTTTLIPNPARQPSPVGIGPAGYAGCLRQSGQTGGHGPGNPKFVERVKQPRPTIALVRESVNMEDSNSVPLEIHEVTFDAINPYRLAQFWSDLLGRQIRPGDGDGDDSVLILERPGQPGLLFMRVPEGKTAKNRIHFDLWPTQSTRDAQIERALRLGAVQLADRRQPDGPGWAVFADPEGNEFCLGSSASERVARRSGSHRE